MQAVLGMNGMPGYYTESANWPGVCPEFDCFEMWKAVKLERVIVQSSIVPLSPDSSCDFGSKVSSKLHI